MIAPFPAHEAISSPEAALYLGHLAAQAEIAAPGSSRESHLALTWLSSIVAHRARRYWTVDFRQLHRPDHQAADWRISAQIEKGDPEQIALARWQWLRSDGRDVSKVAHDVLVESGMTEAATPVEREQKLAEISALILIQETSEPRWSRQLRDATGTMILFSAHQKAGLASLKRRFLSL